MRDKALIVDDEKNNREVYGLYVQSQGLTPILKPDYDFTLTQQLADELAIAMCDYHCPPNNGGPWYKANKVYLRDVRVIPMSGGEGWQQALQEELSDLTNFPKILTKPFRLSLIGKIIEELK